MSSTVTCRAGLCVLFILINGKDQGDKTYKCDCHQGSSGHGDNEDNDAKFY